MTKILALYRDHIVYWLVTRSLYKVALSEVFLVAINISNNPFVTSQKAMRTHCKSDGTGTVCIIQLINLRGNILMLSTPQGARWKYITTLDGKVSCLSSLFSF